MRFWFDTEFYEGFEIELISIGVVAEDGREYYAETPVAEHLAACTDWLKENVRPNLTGQRRPKTEIRLDLIEFMGSKPEIWAYYAAYDWVLLCRLYGGLMKLPKGWPRYCRDVKWLLDEQGIEAPPNEGAVHNALTDARWTKLAWDRCRRPQRALAQLTA